MNRFDIPYRISLQAVRDGEEAVRYLKREWECSDLKFHRMPNVILTNLRMPRMDGFEFLKWLRNHPECGTIPTMVYGSAQEEVVHEAHSPGANAYYQRPTSIINTREFVHFAMSSGRAAKHRSRR